MMQWQSQEAKAKFSELIRLVKKEPQLITVRGQAEAVLVSKQYYDTVMHTEENFVEFMQKSPLYGTDISFERDKSLSRDIEL